MPRIKKYMRTPWCFVLCSIFCIVCCDGPPARGQHPNIVLILADDLGYGDLSSYGAVDMQTPHIDSLVTGGLRFTHFYANSPVCSPTRASLMTGRYPPMAGVPGVIRTHAANSWGALRQDLPLLPEMLKRGGYHTALIGKWHLGLAPPDTPIDRGFDYFHGYLGDMMDDYYTHRRHGINYMRRNREAIQPTGHATDLFTDWAVDYVFERSASEAPFFLYLAYNAPHTPIQPPREWVERVVQREPGISEQRARLVALVEHMDHGIGEVVDALKRTGVYENTLIVFTSDNGGQLNVGANNGALRDGKQSVYEGGLKVPACLVWPQRIEAGRRTEQIALTMDLFPTLVEAAGLEVSHFIEGRSFLPLLTGEPFDPPRRDIFFSRREGGMRYGGKTIEALRRGPWKLLQNSPYAPQELYHLREDPREEHNLIEEEGEVVRDLAQALREYIRLAGAIPWQH